jgi:hypothetical protein
MEPDGIPAALDGLGNPAGRRPALNSTKLNSTKGPKAHAGGGRLHDLAAEPA